MWQVIGTVTGVLSFLTTIALGILGWYVYTKITANDLAHLSKFALDLKQEFQGFIKDCKACSRDNADVLRKLDARVSSIEGYLRGQHEQSNSRG
jgi:hypothetical protein